MVQKNRFPKFITSLATAWFLLQLIALNSACKHSPLFDDDDINPIDTLTPIDTSDVDTIPTGTPCDPNLVYFENEVLPILLSNCAMSGCHNAASQQDGIILDSYNSVMQTAEITPFNAANSELYEVITDDDPDDRMPPPPSAALSQDQIQIIAQWINQGAKNLDCDPNAGACDTTNQSYTQNIKPVIDTYCKGCHSGNNPSGNIGLENYASVKAVALNGKLYGAISWAAGYQKMPQGGNKLDDCTISKFKAWIDGGVVE